MNYTLWRDQWQSRAEPGRDGPSRAEPSRRAGPGRPNQFSDPVICVFRSMGKVIGVPVGCVRKFTEWFFVVGCCFGYKSWSTKVGLIRFGAGPDRIRPDRSGTGSERDRMGAGPVWSRTDSDTVEPGRAGPGRAGPGRAEPSRAGPSQAEPASAGTRNSLPG